MGSIRNLIIAKENPLSVEHSARTAVAGVISLVVARRFGLSESYWACITTTAVMQSTLGATLPITVYRVIGGIAGYLLIGMTWAFAYQLLVEQALNAIQFEAPWVTVPHGSRTTSYISALSLGE